MTQNVSDSPSRAVGDVELARAAAGGDSAAFDDLYRRHAEAAWRVAYAVTGNRDDAADAVAEAFTRVLGALSAGRLADLERVRSYLLATTRNAAIDVLRRHGSLEPLDNLPLERSGSPTAGPSDRILERLDASLVAAAFRGLPERWRSVLWLTEVEGMAPAEAARLLGVSANNAAQLAVRARAGLRQRFLQAHLRHDAPGECAFTRERLGAYVGGGLGARDVAKVDQHLAGCPACRAELDELEDLGTTLRRMAIPLPAALGALAWGHWLRSSAADSASRPLLGGLGVNRTLTGASVALLGIGVIALGILGHPDPGLASQSGRPGATPAVGSRPVVLAETAAASSAAPPPLPLSLTGASGTAGFSGGGSATPGSPAGTTTAASSGGGAASAGSSGTGPGGTSSGGGGTGVSVPPVVPTSSGPTLQLSGEISLAPAPVNLSVGAGTGSGSSAGLGVTSPAGTQSAGQPPASSTGTSSGSSTPDASVTVVAPGAGTVSATEPSQTAAPTTTSTTTTTLSGGLSLP